MVLDKVRLPSLWHEDGPDVVFFQFQLGAYPFADLRVILGI